MPKPEKPERLERHSGTGLRGLPKKEGHAAKGGWGKAGTGEDGESCIDHQDPNYASDEEVENVVINKVELASPIDVIVNEYLGSADLDEAIKGIKELNNPDILPRFVKKALFMSMEQQAYERELISKLLSTAYSVALPPTLIYDGFQLALDNIEDAALDSPDAPELLSKFLARAIVDEIVPPIFLKEAETVNPKAQEVLKLATGLVNEKHGSERLANIWGPGDLCSVKRLKKEALLLLKEYLIHADVNEAEKSIRKLNAPSFNFQLVKIAIRLALENGNGPATQKILALFSGLLKTGLFLPGHLERGFRCCYETLDDIKLDVPHAEALLNDISAKAIELGLLPKTFFEAKKETSVKDEPKEVEKSA